MPETYGKKRVPPRPCFPKRKTATPRCEVAERNGRAGRKKAAIYRDFFLWRFLRSLFFLLCVAILWRLRFLPQGIFVDGLVQVKNWKYKDIAGWVQRYFDLPSPGIVKIALNPPKTAHDSAIL